MYFCKCKQAKVIDMNAISLNNLWSYLQGLSLTASNQRWLASHLMEAAESVGIKVKGFISESSAAYISKIYDIRAFSKVMVNMQLAVEKGGQVIAASFWGKLKTVTQMCAIILAFIDIHGFGEFIKSGFYFTRLGLIVNILNTLLMSIAVVATIFSGYDYLKKGKEFFND